MSSTITSKRTRIQECTISQNPNSLPIKLPQSIIHTISTYLNFKDARNMTEGCKNFRTIPLYYFRGATHTMQGALNRRLLKTLYTQEECGLDAFPDSWRKGFENALPSLKEFDMVQNEDNEYCEGYNVPEKQLIHILNSAKSLQKLYLGGCSQKIVTLASTLNLIELELNTAFNHFDYSFFNKSLKILKIEYYNRESKPLYFTNINNVDPSLPNIETLSILVDEFFDETFFRHFPSLNTLKYLGNKTTISSETFSLLKNLKNFTCSDNLELISQLKYSYSLENLTIKFPGKVPPQISNKLDTIIPSMTNLKRVNLDNTGMQNLPKIVALNHVYVNFGFLDKSNLVADINNVKHAKASFIFIKNFNEVIVQSIASMKNLEKLNIFFDDSYLNDQTDPKSLSIKEAHIISCFNLCSKKITAIKESSIFYEKFFWSKRILTQLKNNPLKKCIRLKGRFHNENNVPIPTAELLTLFPSVTEDKITRIWEGRN